MGEPCDGLYLWRYDVDEPCAEEDEEDGEGDPGQVLQADVGGQVCNQP